MVSQDIPQYTKIPAGGSPRVAPAVGQGSHFPFTKKLIDRLSIPSDQRTYYYDTGQRGLVLIVHPTGRRTFSFYRKIDGCP